MVISNLYSIHFINVDNYKHLLNIQQISCTESYEYKPVNHLSISH